MAEQLVPPVPYKTPVLDQAGYLSPSWSAWFRQLFIRIGQARALSNTELENLQLVELEGIEAEVEALQTTSASHTTSIATLTTAVNDLGQGPLL